jgi:phage terminase large subunit
MRDFFEILHKENIYSEKYHNKSDSTYLLFGNRVEFFSVDESQKVRGRKRDFLFLNEANEFAFEDWQQLVLRTTEKVIMDYNPSDEYHWIYDSVLVREDCQFYKSTYLDNPFLSEVQVKEIELLKETDEYYWQVYGLGERGQSREIIFQTHSYKERPAGAKLIAYGLDWGYTNDPTALAAVYQDGESIYIEEEMYVKGLTNSQIAAMLRDKGIPRQVEIIADSAEPKSIDEIHRMGFNIKPAVKGADSVRVGIDIMRRHKIFIHEQSQNAMKEFRNYKWQVDKNGRILETPVDAWNHIVDAVRYVCLKKLVYKKGTYAIR